jgi:glycosyltransferase involved in cell wall biosynthesis
VVEHENFECTDGSESQSGKPRVMFVSQMCYFDTYNGASVATRSLMECLARRGLPAMAVTGTVVEMGEELDPGNWLAEQGLVPEFFDGQANSTSTVALEVDAPHYRLAAGGVQVVLHKSPTTRPHEPEEPEISGFLRLFEGILDDFHPNVLLNFGGDPLAAEIRRRARARGIAVVFALHNFNYRNRAPFQDVDAVIVPSRFAASYYRRSLDLTCTVLPYLMAVDRFKVASREPRYVTFVNPSHEKGVFAFARMADELGRRRPDIPLLVVEGRGTERTLVDCGLDLRAHGNVSLMRHTPDPRLFWSVTRICVMPSVWWENQPLVAIEAMTNGIPVVGSDRGGIPETLGDSGIVLGLPSRLSPTTCELPTAEEIGPWVKAIIALWEDKEWYAELSRRAIVESSRWEPEVLEPQHVDFFERLLKSHHHSLGRQPEHEFDSVSLGTRTRQERAVAPGGPRSEPPGGLTEMTSRAEFGAFLNQRGLLGTGVEIGVENGIFARCVLNLWQGERLYLVDIWQELDDYWDVTNAPAAEQAARLIRTVQNVTPFWERVRVFQERSELAAQFFSDGSLDWIYLDANHEYTHVLRDLAAWAPKVKAGGIVAGHDFLDEVLPIRGVATVFGVKRAVREFFAGQDVCSTEDRFPTWYVTKLSEPPQVAPRRSEEGQTKR